MTTNPFAMLYRMHAGMSARALATALGWSETTTRKHLARWEAQGLVTRVSVCWSRAAHYRITARGIIMCSGPLPDHTSGWLAACRIQWRNRTALEREVRRMRERETLPPCAPDGRVLH